MTDHVSIPALLGAAILIGAQPARAAITLDSTTSAREYARSTLTVDHTIAGGPDRLLVVCIAVEEDAFDADVSVVTYDGVVMTKAIDRLVGTTTDMNVEIWYLLDADLPPAGTHSLFIDCPDLAGPSEILATAISVTGAAQAGPEATASTTDAESAATSIQASITTVTNEAWIFDCVGSGDPHPGFTADFGQFERSDVLGRTARMAAGTKEKPIAGLETLGWSMPYSVRSAYALAAFAPAAVPAVPAAPGTINYRSIGTDAGILHATGDASIAGGTSSVTLAGGANLPADVGTGDRLTIFDGTITRHESVVAGTSSSPVSMPSIPGGNDQFYALLVSTRSNVDVTAVSGGGLDWQERIVQCGDDSETGIRIWTAAGSPASSFQAQVTWNASSSLRLAAVLVRYSGVGGFEDATSENINGEFGACTNATDTSTVQLTLTSTADGSVHLVGVAPRDDTVSAYAPYAQIATITTGAGPNETRIAAYDRTLDPAGNDTFTATLSNTDDWATAGIVLKPATTFNIRSRDSATDLTIQETAAATITNAPYEIHRAYNTMQGWEDERQGDLVADDRREVGVCYNDGAFTDQVVISGSTTDAARYMRLTVAEGERHEGTQNWGAVIDAQGGWSGGDAITVEDEYTRIEWLEIKAIQDLGDGVYFSASPAADNGVVSHLFIHSFWQNYPNAGVNVDATGVAIRNCVMTGGSAIAVLIGAGGSATVESCTIIGSPGSGHGVYTTAGTVGIVNTISVDHVVGYDFYVETTGAATLTSFGYNLYANTGGGFNPANYEGGNQSPPADINDLFVNAGTGNYRLKTNNDAIDNGRDLTANGFSIDIDNYPRLETWDIGADQCNTKRPARTFRRSIGTETLPLYATGTATIEPYSSVVTFGAGASLPWNVGAGDELVIGADTYYIHERDSATQVRVQEAPTFFPQYGASYTVSRAYNTMQDWETDRSGNLFIGNMREIGICYNDGPFTGPLNLSGCITIPSNSMDLTVAPGHRHNGTPGTGVVIDAGGGVGVNVVEINTISTNVEWLEITNVLDNAHPVFINSASAVHQVNVSNLLVHNFGSGATTTGLRIAGLNITARNCIVYDGTSRGIVVTAAAADAIIENCTVYGMTSDGIKSNVGSTVEIRNTVSVGNDALSYDFNLAGIINYFGNNMFDTTFNFDPASYQGDNQAPPADLNSLFFSITPTMEDLHLEPTGHQAGNKGLDLSTSFTADVDNETRHGSWDIGADEAVSYVGKPVIISWKEVEP